MKRKILRNIVFEMVVASALNFMIYDPVVSAKTLKMPIIKENISMSYDVAGVKMPDESEKEAMKIAQNVTKDFFKALSDKQYRVAYNYFSSEVQSKMGYEAFVNGFSKTLYINLGYCGPIFYEGNLVILDGEYTEAFRTDDGKFDPRLFRFKLAINKIGNEWKIVDLVEKDVTLDHI